MLTLRAKMQRSCVPSCRNGRQTACTKVCCKSYMFRNRECSYTREKDLVLVNTPTHIPNSGLPLTVHISAREFASRLADLRALAPIGARGQVAPAALPYPNPTPAPPTRSRAIGGPSGAQRIRDLSIWSLRCKKTLDRIHLSYIMFENLHFYLPESQNGKRLQKVAGWLDTFCFVEMHCEVYTLAQK